MFCVKIPNCITICVLRLICLAMVSRSQPTDGPIYFRHFQGMDKWDVMMQNRDARVINTITNAKAGWWDFQGFSPSRKPAA